MFFHYYFETWLSCLHVDITSFVEKAQPVEIVFLYLIKWGLSLCSILMHLETLRFEVYLHLICFLVNQMESRILFYFFITTKFVVLEIWEFFVLLIIIIIVSVCVLKKYGGVHLFIFTETSRLKSESLRKKWSCWRIYLIPTLLWVKSIIFCLYIKLMMHNTFFDYPFVIFRDIWVQTGRRKP